MSLYKHWFVETQESMQHQLLAGCQDAADCIQAVDGGNSFMGNNLHFFYGVIYVGPISPVCCCSLTVCWEWRWCLEQLPDQLNSPVAPVASVTFEQVQAEQTIPVQQPQTSVLPVVTQRVITASC